MTGYNVYGMGATTVGIKASDGVVLASEKRASYGGYIVSRSARKVFAINDRFGIACAGLFADMQAISRMLKAEISYYEVELKRRMKASAAAKLLANILYSYKLMPLLSETLFGGVDEEGPHLFVMDPLGSMIEDNYASVGSGAPIAIGLLEARYKEDLGVEDARSLAVESIKVAVERDAISGDGIDLLVITPRGVREETLPLG